MLGIGKCSEQSRTAWVGIKCTSITNIEQFWARMTQKGIGSKNVNYIFLNIFDNNSLKI